jgi:hypothetical protein
MGECGLALASILVLLRTPERLQKAGPFSNRASLDKVFCPKTDTTSLPLVQFIFDRK